MHRRSSGSQSTLRSQPPLPRADMAACLAQSWVVFGVLVNALGQGMMLSYPACLLPALKAEHAEIKADLGTSSWLASSIGLSGVLGFLASSWLMEVRGRRATLAAATLPGALGWLFIYFAKDVSTLMIGRILGGISGGATVTLGAIVLGEYTSPENRGMFLNLKAAAICVGNMAIHVLNNYLDWRQIALFALTPFVMSFCAVCCIEESPSWLAAKGYLAKSEKVFYKLRGKNDDTYQEFKDLIKLQKMQASNHSLSKLKVMKRFLGQFKNKQVVKPLFLVVISGVLSEFSGRHVFPAYAPDIIGSITGDKTQSFFYTLSIDLIITTSVTLSSVLIRVTKRRVLLFSTGLTSLVVLISVCSYLYLASIDVVPSNKPWIPLSLFVVYFVLANLCCTPFPFLIVGEIIPLAHKGSASAVTGVFLALILMIALKVAPYMLISLHVYGTFAIFAMVNGICLVVMYFLLPETKDRSLPEIEHFFYTGTFDISEDNEVSTKMIS